jgi:chemotaxis protein methyltransferase CheR
MKPSIQLERLQSLVEERFGLLCTDWQRERLVVALAGRSPGGRAPQAEGPDLSSAELRELAQELTVGESYFFRDPAQIEAFVEAAIPARASVSTGGTIRVLSAGCSSGDEAYSMAIALAERRPDLAGRVAIVGVDVHPGAIQKARAACYSPWALRGIDDRLRSRYFRRNGRDHELVEEIRCRVTFEERNLFDDDPRFWAPGAFDVVFCRNVAIYFSERSTRALAARLSHAISPGGYVFLGASETLRGISEDFELVCSHETFYYRRPARPGSARPPADARTQPARRPPAAPAAASEVLSTRAPPALAPAPVRSAGDDLWVEAIRRASERIAQLASAPHPAESPPPPRKKEASAPAAASLSPIVELVHAERFAEALALFEALPPEVRSQPAPQTVAAVIVSSQGRLAEAEETCVRLLGTPEAARARYVLGLCREHAGDRAHAEKHHREASSLDPSFAMPWLRLGLLARRAGDHAAARSAFRRAFDRMTAEPVERIHLFGGGFSREMLLDVCKNQLRSLGEGR